MELRESDRIRNRLMALDLRIAELDQERHQTQVRVHHLEAALEDARLAHLVGGDEAGDPAELGPELERRRGELEHRSEEVARIRKLRQTARVQCVTQRLRERREDRQRLDGSEVEGSASGSAEAGQ